MRNKDNNRKHIKKEKEERIKTHGEQQARKQETKNTTQGTKKGHTLNKSKHIREPLSHTEIKNHTRKKEKRQITNNKQAKQKRNN